MNRYVNMSLAFGMSAFLGAAVQVSAQAKPETAKPPMNQTKTAKPSTDKPQTTGAAVSLGAIRIPRAVKGDGQPLPAGTYQVRVTETPASPPAPGPTPQYERWAEFMQGGKVVAREVVTIVPASDIKEVAEQNPPRAGGYRAEVLKGNDYLRLWINRGGNHYLIHFNI